MADTVVAILSVVLLVLVVLLVFFYKKLNKEANNQYTVRNIIYKKGGVRDRVRTAALAVETRLGIQVWPRGHDEEEGEEMEEIQDEEGEVESGNSQHQSDGSDTDGENEQEEDSGDHSGSTKENEGDNSDAESSKAGEEVRLIDNKPDEYDDVGDNSEEKQGKEQGKAEASGGTGLLIDLKQFSGSAIWSEQKEDESQGGDVTAL